MFLMFQLFLSQTIVISNKKCGPLEFELIDCIRNLYTKCYFFNQLSLLLSLFIYVPYLKGASKFLRRREAAGRRFDQITLLTLYSDRQDWANSLDPDQMPQNAASDQGLYCFQLILQLILVYTVWSGLSLDKYGILSSNVKRLCQKVKVTLFYMYRYNVGQ